MIHVVTGLIGLFGGFISGLLGVGGGFVFVPLLMALKGFNAHLAIGTSLLVIVPTAICGALLHGKAEMVDLRTALFLAIFSILGVWIGSTLSLKLSVSLLRRLFAVLLVVLAFKLFFQR